jgi:hypothetical protein
MIYTSCRKIFRFVSLSGPPLPTRSKRSTALNRKPTQIFRFCLRIKDGTAEADVRLFGAEAERFLGVTADVFARNKSTRMRVKKALEDACVASVMKEDVSAASSAPTSAPVPLSDPSTAVYWKSGEEEIMENNGEDDSAMSVDDNYASTPLLNFNLFSYQPGSVVEEHENIALAVYGTVLSLNFH